MPRLYKTIRRILSQSFARRLESRIIADPTQWWWFHRRFARDLYSR